MMYVREQVKDAEPFGLYIHWPFCAAKCPYCDFNSYARRGVDESSYLSAYRMELDYYAGLTPGRIVTSIFFGGGTPSLMGAAAVGGILDHISSLWPIAADAEITLEANPSSVEAERFAGYRVAGVNRASLGVQSLRDADLRFLGRLHNSAEARAALAIAKQHFSRVSFDLIYARPNQSLADWRRELSEALQLAAGHLSLYQLTIEPGTAFYELEHAGKLVIPASGEAAALYEVTQQLCDAAGLPAYEISNHAAPGEESRHNLLYWRYGEYAGIGPGAHGRIAHHGQRLALAAVREPEAWRRQVENLGRGLASRDTLTRLDAAQEMLIMGLRLAEGVDVARLRALTGYTITRPAIEMLQSEGHIEAHAPSERLIAAKRGRLVLNTVISTLAGALQGSAAEAA